MHTVGRDGSGAGAPPRAHRNALLLGIVDKVPYNEIIVYITHPADDGDLIFQSLPVAVRRIHVPLPEAVKAELAEVFLVGEALRHRESGQMIFVEGELQIAPFGNLPRVFKGLAAAGEQLPQLLLAFEVKLIPLEAHPVGIVHGFAGLDAQQHILHFGVLPAQVVGVVGHHKGQARLPGNPSDALVHRLLGVDAVILQFQVEVVLPEDFRHLQGVSLGGGVVLVHQILGDGPRQAGGQGNQPLMVLPQQPQIHPRLAVKAADKGLGNQLAQIFVAGAILAKKNQVVRIIVQTVNPVLHPAAGHIHLAADDRLDPGGLSGLVEINTAVHNAVVGDGHRRLAQLLHPLHQTVNPAGAVQEAVFRMHVQMYKAHIVPSPASSTSFFSLWLMALLVMGGSIISASSVRADSGCSSRAAAA